jgi:hypothetical protein
MIDKRELRIGSKVASPKHGLAIATIAGIATNNIVMLEEVSTYDFSSDIEPIPVTAEWLLGTGFVDEGPHDNGDHFWTQKDLNVGFDGEAFSYYDDWGIHYLGICKHIHQFQNHFYCLTGEELTIKETE